MPMLAQSQVARKDEVGARLRNRSALIGADGRLLATSSSDQTVRLGPPAGAPR